VFWRPRIRADHGTRIGQSSNHSLTVTDSRLLVELESVAEAGLDHHLASTTNWHPHDYVPWSDGTDYGTVSGRDWASDQSRLSELARNGIALRDYLVVTRAVDPVELEQAGMRQVAAGYSPGRQGQGSVGPESMLDTLVYLTFQELATSTDENLHILLPPRGNAVKMEVRQHLDDVILPVLRHWRVFERDDFTGEGVSYATNSRSSSRACKPRRPSSRSPRRVTSRATPPRRKARLHPLRSTSDDQRLTINV